MYCRLPPGTVNDSRAVRQLPDSLIIESNYRVWGATVRNEEPYSVIQSAFEHGLKCGGLGIETNRYDGAEAIPWLRGYFKSLGQYSCGASK